MAAGGQAANLANKMRANRKVLESKCTSCGQTFTFGAEVYPCLVCGGYHHASCWESGGAYAGSVADASAVRAVVNPPRLPLAEPTILALVPRAVPVPLADGEEYCSYCGNVVKIEALKCRFCGHALRELALREMPVSGENGTSSIFSFKGRAGRASFWLWGLVQFGCFVLCAWATSRIPVYSLRQHTNLAVTILFAAIALSSLIVIVLAAWLGLALRVKRWHDLSQSEWMVLCY